MLALQIVCVYGLIYQKYSSELTPEKERRSFYVEFCAIFGAKLHIKNSFLLLDNISDGPVYMTGE
jgi:hypothetical protein